MNPLKSEMKKKHRHKWQLEIYDCMLCGGGEAYECECGEVKALHPKKKKK